LKGNAEKTVKSKKKPKSVIKMADYKRETFSVKNHVRNFENSEGN